MSANITDTRRIIAEAITAWETDRQLAQVELQRHDGEQCVETGTDGGTILVRDTTDRDGGTLAFPPAWAKFPASLR